MLFKSTHIVMTRQMQNIHHIYCSVQHLDKHVNNYALMTQTTIYLNTQFRHGQGQHDVPCVCVSPPYPLPQCYSAMQIYKYKYLYFASSTYMQIKKVQMLQKLQKNIQTIPYLASQCDSAIHRKYSRVPSYPQIWPKLILAPGSCTQ